MCNKSQWQKPKYNGYNQTEQRANAKGTFEKQQQWSIKRTERPQRHEEVLRSGELLTTKLLPLAKVRAQTRGARIHRRIEHSVIFRRQVQAYTVKARAGRTGVLVRARCVWFHNFRRHESTKILMQENTVLATVQRIPLVIDEHHFYTFTLPNSTALFYFILYITQ